MEAKIRKLGSSLIPVFDKAERELHRDLHARLQGRVRYGPFAGMVAPAEFSWGSATPKLLGLYENCLHDVIASLPGLGVDAVMDIGCAEGYYAVGLARLLSGVPIFAHDTMKSARVITSQLGEANKVSDRLTVGGIVDHALLQSWLSRWRRPLLVVDIEGGELPLLDPDQVPSLRDALILVEVHDFVDRGLSATILARFSDTHAMERIWEADLAPTNYPELAALPATLRAVALCELRPERMSWLWMRPLRQQP